MTVNSTSDSEMSISLLATLAYRKAGLVHMTQTPHSDQLTAAYQFLEVLVRRATVLGNQARFRGFDTVTLVSGTRQYNLAATTLDAVGDGMYIDAGEDEDAATGEVLVKRIDFELRQRLTDKSSLGRPTLLYVDRTGQRPFLWLWPIPDTTDAKIRVPVHRRAADSTDGSTTLDVQPHWYDYYVTALAADLAQASSKTTVAMMLIAQSKKLFDEAASFSGRGEPGQAIVDHRYYC
jgi:hypothetical protein